MCRTLGRGSVVICGGEIVPAVFRNAYDEASGTESRIPMLTVPTADVERLMARKGAEVDVDGKLYTVQRHEPDGAGMSIVYLV